MPRPRPRSRARYHHRSRMARLRHGGHCRCNRDRYSHLPPACLPALRRPDSSLPAGRAVCAVPAPSGRAPRACYPPHPPYVSPRMHTSLSIGGALSRYGMVQLQPVCQRSSRVVDEHRLQERLLAPLRLLPGLFVPQAPRLGGSGRRSTRRAPRGCQITLLWISGWRTHCLVA
jgi:hypothetical protein